jgi:hypothetical protein
LVKRVVVPAVLSGIALTAISVPLQAEGDGQLHIPTVTRLVQQFTAYEDAIIESIARRDAAGLQKSLTNDFELRIAANPGVPTPRADWIRLSLTESHKLTGIEQMAVHDHGDVMVVSFLGKRDGIGAKGNVFVVDVWVRSGRDWKLSTRYAGPAGDSRFAVPGAGQGTPAIEKKY